MSKTYTVTPNDNAGGGTFTPSSVTLTVDAPSATFKYTAASGGIKTIKTTNSGGLINPSGLSCSILLGQLPGSATVNELLNSVPTTRTPIAALAPGTGNYFDSQSYDPCVLVNPTDSTQLIMFFSGMAAPVAFGAQTIGRATASITAPSVWTVSASPVLTPTLAWETGGDGLRADSVVYNAADSKIYLFYTAKSGTTGVGVASSTDLGLTWTKLGQAIVPSGGETNLSQMSVLLEGTTLHGIYAYRNGGVLPAYRYASATTANWLSWTKGGVDIYHDPSAGRYHEFHHLFKVGSTYVLCYESGSTTVPYDIRLASSSSPSSGWTIGPVVPFLAKSAVVGTFDEFHTATAHARVINGFWYVIYCGALDHDQPYGTNHWQMGIVPLYQTPVSPATTYSLSGPSSGVTSTASTNFTVALPGSTSVSGTVTVTPSDGGGGGTFTPTSVGLTTGAPSATFTYTPVSIGVKTISVTNSGGLTNPANLTYTVVTSLRLWLKADAIAGPPADGTAMATWVDSSGNGNDAGQTNGTWKPLFKTNRINGLPAMKFDSDDRMTVNMLGAITTAVTVFIVQRKNINSGTLALASDPTNASNSFAIYLPFSDGNVYFDLGNTTSGGRISAAWGGDFVNFFVWSFVAGGGNMAIYRNGTSVVSSGGHTNVFAPAGLTLVIDSGDAAGTIPSQDADIAEIIIHNIALGTTDRVAQENSLRTKYGL